MRFQLRRSLAAAALAALAVGSSGCINAILTDGQIAATRKAAVAVNTIADYELQRSATEAGLAQFEGMHLLRPGNEDALFLLTQAWGGYAYAFPQDAYEDALDAGQDDLAAYHKKRARLAYDRAVFFGLELLSHRADGFDAAKRNADTLQPWLADHFTNAEDAENLFWVGYAWLSRVDLFRDDPAMVAELFVGVDMIERSVAIDPTLEHWSGTIALAAYHARPAGEIDQAKQMFELALAKSARKNLQVQLNYATAYACMKQDRAQYEGLLNEVLSATDPDPEQRLVNMLAKRRARRALSKQHMLDCGFDMSSHAATPAKAPVAPAPSPALAPAPGPPPGATPAPAAPHTH
jgi:tetratricopeptide (TPR) repeat protein